MNEYQLEKEKQLEEKGKWFKEVDVLKHTIDELKEKSEMQKIEIGELNSKFGCASEKISNYENEILMRT